MVTLRCVSIHQVLRKKFLKVDFESCRDWSFEVQKVRLGFKGEIEKRKKKNEESSKRHNSGKE